jgi:RNA polymerase sigma-70 factor (ECF subfamily)
LAAMLLWFVVPHSAQKLLRQSKREFNTFFLQEIKGRRLSTQAPQPETSDATLVARVRAGDQASMAALYDRYSGIVYATALRVLGETGAAEDVLQEIFMQLWRKPAAFDSSRGNLPAWLGVIARHRAIDVLRKRKPETDVEDVVIASTHDLRTEAERNTIVAKVRAAMAEMPAEQRRCMEMAYFEGLTHSEIASKTGEPLGTVKTRIRSALTQLRKRLGESS